MRVIAGRFRGTPLDAPEGSTTRPITDRAKESVFNVLGSRFGEPGSLPEVDVLDVFAGSGGLGIESLSRGARRCWFIERDQRALRVLERNLARLKLAPGVARVIPASAWTLRPPATEGGFGLIFADPPYRDSQTAARSLGLLERLSGALGPRGVLVFRLATTSPFEPSAAPSLALVDERIFGTMRVLLFEARGTSQEEAPGGG